jgi:hypothetical protein
LAGGAKTPRGIFAGAANPKGALAGEAIPNTTTDPGGAKLGASSALLVFTRSTAAGFRRFAGRDPEDFDFRVAMIYLLCRRPQDRHPS